jgi:hypothetical protein
MTWHASPESAAEAIEGSFPLRAYTVFTTNFEALTFTIITPGEEPRGGATFLVSRRDCHC